MQSVTQLYKIGHGPSSSHSMGPKRAAELFRARCGAPLARVTVELYGSLAATGKGHLTDHAVIDALQPLPVDVVWRADVLLPRHPNALRFAGFDRAGAELSAWVVYSIGGGALADDSGALDSAPQRAYPCDAIADVLAWCRARHVPVWQFVAAHEPPETPAALQRVWQVMTAAVQRGLTAHGPLPGGLQLARRAAALLAHANTRVGLQRDLNLLAAYAVAAAEENAAGGEIVTAPTCGACGVVPAVLYYFHRHHGVDDERMLHALMTAGVFGSSVAARASISGSEVGCQGEIGVAAAMAAAAATQLLGGTNAQVEYAAEMALEHSLGLTCDPVLGLVQVPCIERNGFAAMKALSCASYALATDGAHLVRFDDVVDAMYATGKDLQAKYRETALGGLAAIMRRRIHSPDEPGQPA